MEGLDGHWRPHVELAIHWSPNNVQRVVALVDTGADHSLIYGNPDSLDQFYVESYSVKTIETKAVTLLLR